MIQTQTPPRPPARPRDGYWEKFEQFQESRAEREPGWLATLRRTNISRFAETGFPTTQDEDWRFTNVTPISRLPLNPRLTVPSGEVTAEQLARFAFSGMKGTRLVFVDGYYAPELSLVDQSTGATVIPLSQGLERHSALLEQHLGRQAPDGQNPFAALNAAFFTDGALIHIPARRKLDGPVRLLHIATAGPDGGTSHLRNLIVAEAGTELTVLEQYVSTGQSAHFTNVATELVVGEGARVEHCKFQDESASAFHIAALHATLGRSCHFTAHSFVTGAKLSRNNIRTLLAGEGVECVLNGLYLTKDDQIADHHMVVDHAKPHCNSHEYFNGILDDRSRGVFHGRILVRPDAQKTDAKQTNKNLLLSDDAGVNTKPQLEIYADDVKCTHGATIGQLHEESIFYLRARGIGQETARRMLMHAFAGEIIDRIGYGPMREELDQLVWDRLEQNRLISVAAR